MNRAFRLAAFLLPAGLFLLVAAPAFAAATGTVRGRVVDVDGLPLKDAIVTLHDQARDRIYTIMTDGKGHYRKTNIPAADYRLKFEKAGYQTLVGTISIVAGKDNVFDANLMPEAKKPEQPLWEDQSARAHDLYVQKKYREALDLYREILISNPDAASVHFGAGNCYYRLKDYEAALHSFREAVRVKPDFFEAYVNLANVSAILKKSDEAIPVVEEAIRSYPENGQLYSSLGLLYLNAGQPAKAVMCLERAAAADPGKPLMYRSLGAAYAQAGNVPKAVESYRKYLGLISDAQEIERVQAVIEELSKK